MINRFLLLSIAMIAVAFTPSFAEPIVPAVQRFQHDDSISPNALGRVLAQELNCVACHAYPQLQGKQAPILTDVANRLNPDYLQRFIAHPQTEKHGTTMPNLFSGISKRKRDKEVNALVHFLMSFGDEVPQQQYATFGSRRRGQVLFHQVGCIACHDPKTENATPLPTSIPYPNLAEKYTLPSLSSFLLNPLHTRPAGRMPSLNLTPREADDIATFLSPPGFETPGIEYHYYRGEWGRFPNLAANRS